LDAKVFTPKNLEEILFNLADDKIISIIGHQLFRLLIQLCYNYQK